MYKNESFATSDSLAKYHRTGFAHRVMNEWYLHTLVYISWIETSFLARSLTSASTSERRFVNWTSYLLIQDKKSFDFYLLYKQYVILVKNEEEYIKISICMLFASFQKI